MPDPDPEMEAATFFSLFNEIGILYQLSSALFEARLPSGFVVSQFAVLNHLIRVKDGRTPLDLARAFQVPKTTMTHSLAVLERHGLVTLTPNPQDGRSKCVWITDAGRAFRDQAIAGILPDMAAIAGRFPVGELSECLPALTRLRRLMDTMRDGN